MVPALVALVAAGQSTLATGKLRLDLDIEGTKLTVYAYKPANYSGKRMIMVFHGTLRNAEEYRDHSIPMGDRFRALIVAPLFDSERFPSLKYQRGGIMKADGSAAPRAEWTYAMVPKIAAQVKVLDGRRRMPHYIIGHSAGGQFLVRMAGFFDSGAERVVAANPGSDLFPNRDMKFGYGFGGLPPELSTDDVIKRYLAQPLTLYLGTGDDHPDENFDMSEAAMAQGGSRYERGLAVFAAGKKLAETRGWPLKWKLVTALRIPHDHSQMFDHPNCELALFGRYLGKDEL